MKKHLLTVLLVLGLSAAVALAQSSAPGQPPSAADPSSRGSMQEPPSQMPDRTGASAQSGAQTQSSDTYGTMDKDKNKDKDKKDSSMANVDDESLHRQVHEQLAGNPDLQSVQITVKNGKVTLEGSVPKKEDKKEAERLAKAVPGVKGVKDRLSVNASASSGSAANVGGVSGAATTAGSTPPAESQSGAGIAAQSQSSTSSSSSGTAIPSTSTPPSSASPSSSAPPADQSSAGTQSSSSATSPSGQTSSTAETSAAPSSAPPSSTPDQSAMGAQSQAGSSATGGVSGQATSQSSVPAGQEAQSQSSVGQQAGSSGQATTSGAISDQSSQSSAQSQSGAMGASSDDQLQQQIQTALKNDPTLANDNVSVTMAADSITLTGEVASGKEKKTAQRIAESFAGNRKVKNEITVSGKGAGSMSSNPSEKPSTEKPPKE